MKIFIQFISLTFMLGLVLSSVATSAPVDPNSVEKQQGVHEKVTDILFYYTQDAIDFFNGDLDKLHEYIASSVRINNEALTQSQIPNLRRIAAILPVKNLPDTEWEHTELTNVSELGVLMDGLASSLNKSDLESIYVLLTLSL